MRIRRQSVRGGSWIPFKIMVEIIKSGLDNSAIFAYNKKDCGAYWDLPIYSADI